MVVLEPQMRAAASSRFPVFQLVIEIGVFGRDLRLGHGLDLFRGEVLDPQRPPVAALEPLVSSIDATTRRSRPLRVMVIGSDKALSSSVSKFLRNSAEEIRISVLLRIGHDNRIFRELLCPSSRRNADRAASKGWVSACAGTNRGAFAAKKAAASLKALCGGRR